MHATLLLDDSSRAEMLYLYPNSKNPSLRFSIKASNSFTIITFAKYYGTDKHITKPLLSKQTSDP